MVNLGQASRFYSSVCRKLRDSDLVCHQQGRYLYFNEKKYLARYGWLPQGLWPTRGILLLRLNISFADSREKFQPSFSIVSVHFLGAEIMTHWPAMVRASILSRRISGIPVRWRKRKSSKYVHVSRWVNGLLQHARKPGPIFPILPTSLDFLWCIFTLNGSSGKKFFRAELKATDAL